MYNTHALFSAEEAFERLGRTRLEGCLVVVSPMKTTRIFTRNGQVVNAYGDEKEGLLALENAFDDPAASYVWLPEVKPDREWIQVGIATHLLQRAVAHDVHVAKTARVKIDGLQTEAPPATTKASPEPSTKARTLPYLTAEDMPGEQFPIFRSTTIIGREETCDIVIDRAPISRRHCMLQLIVRGLAFRDLDSTNGVFVNGIRSKEGFLEPGDHLSLGTYCLILHGEKK